jgi:2,3-bisphosphoglycerate-independent phosphoglycerate mutase
MLVSPYTRPQTMIKFGERACVSGDLGTFPAVDLMPLLLANALKLGKYGA